MLQKDGYAEDCQGRRIVRAQMRAGRAVQEQETRHRRARVGARDARRDVEKA